jgi:hypothetical protein
MAFQHRHQGPDSALGWCYEFFSFPAFLLSFLSLHVPMNDFLESLWLAKTCISEGGNPYPWFWSHLSRWPGFELLLEKDSFFFQSILMTIIVHDPSWLRPVVHCSDNDSSIRSLLASFRERWAFHVPSSPVDYLRPCPTGIPERGFRMLQMVIDDSDQWISHPHLAIIAWRAYENEAGQRRRSTGRLASPFAHAVSAWTVQLAMTWVWSLDCLSGVYGVLHEFQRPEQSRHARFHCK